MSEHIGNLEINMEKQAPIFDTSQKRMEPVEKNARLDYIEQADMLERMSKSEQKREIEYSKLAEKWEEMNAAGEGGGNFAGAKSYAQVVNTMNRLVEMGKLKMDKKKQEVIRRSAKAYFANRKTNEKLMSKQYAPNHEKLLDNERDLLDTWRVKGDSRQMKNLKTSIRTLRVLRQKPLISGQSMSSIMGLIKDRKKEMDGAMDDVIKKCRIYMKHVDDPGSDTGKKRLNLASDILYQMQLEKNTQDDMEFDNLSVVKGMAAFPLGVAMEWHDLVEYMLRADEIMGGGTIDDQEDAKAILDYLESDCAAESKSLIPNLKVKTNREILKAVGKSNAISAYEDSKRKIAEVDAVRTMGVASQTLLSNNVSDKQGYCYDENTEAIIMKITNSEFLEYDDNLTSIGVPDDKLAEFRADMKKLVAKSKTVTEIQTLGITTMNIMGQPFGGKFDIKDRNNKPNADQLMADIQETMRDEYYYKTHAKMANLIDGTLLLEFMKDVASIFSKYKIDFAKVYRDNETERYAGNHDEIVEKENRNYEKDKPMYDGVIAEMDAKEVVPMRTINVGGIELQIAKTAENPFTDDYSDVILDEEEQYELETLINEYNFVTNKAIVYTDMRHRLIDTGRSFNSEAVEIEENDYIRQFGDQIEEEYGKSEEGLQIVSESVEEFEKAEKDGDYLDKLVINHLEDLFGSSKERITSLSYHLDNTEKESIKQYLDDKLQDYQVNDFYKDEQLGAENIYESDTVRGKVILALLRAYKLFYDNKIYVKKVAFYGKIVGKYNDQQKSKFNFVRAFKEKGKIAYSDEFIEKNAKWLVDGHGQRSYFRFDMFNKQEYYTDRSASLSNKIKSVLKKK